MTPLSLFILLSFSDRKKKGWQRIAMTPPLSLGFSWSFFGSPVTLLTSLGPLRLWLSWGHHTIYPKRGGVAMPSLKSALASAMATTRNYCYAPERRAKAIQWLDSNNLAHCADQSLHSTSPFNPPSTPPHSLSLSQRSKGMELGKEKKWASKGCHRPHLPLPKFLSVFLKERGWLSWAAPDVSWASPGPPQVFSWSFRGSPMALMASLGPLLLWLSWGHQTVYPKKGWGGNDTFFFYIPLSLSLTQREI